MKKAFLLLFLIYLSISPLIAQKTPYSWGDVRFSKELIRTFPKTDLLKFTKLGKRVEFELINSEFEAMLTYAENHGYPFAEIRFDSLEIIDSTVNVFINFQLNELVKFDSLSIINKKVIRYNFLSSYLGIKVGDVYNESRVKELKNRIEELGFINLKYQPKIYFANEKAVIVLDPEKRNANKFDGLIGVQPSNIGAKTSIIGQANLYLVNVFGRAERASVDFRSQANQTRDLKIMLSYPYIFSSAFGITGNLDIRRQDTSFSILSRAISIQYLMRANNQINFNYRITESNLLSTKKYSNATELPNNLDVNKRLYGLQFNFEKLDYRLNPSKGYSFIGSGYVGNREVLKNAGLEDSLYKDIKLKSTQFQFAIGIRKFFKLKDRLTLLTSIKSELILADELFNNELLRFGGINDLRGFDEESIFSSNYSFGTIEFRYLLDRNSFVRAFLDQAYYFNQLLSIEDYPRGVGIGVQLQTKAGMLQLNYALGMQKNSNFNFQTGKIHLGIINYF